MGLSATADGKKLLVLQGTSQYDIYLGEFDSKSVRLKTTRQFTSDERDDIPAAWTRDGKGLLFISDRSGSYDIYRQAVQGSGLQAIVAGPTDEYEPRFSPDGSWLFYWAGSFPDSAPKRACGCRLWAAAQNLCLLVVQMRRSVAHPTGEPPAF